MTEALGASKLLEHAKARCEALGLTVTPRAGGFSGEIESIKSKWWFGGRKVLYRMSCRLDEAARTLLFREGVRETSWGMPPPTITVETETISGWERKGKRSDVAPGGGGALDYARVREALEVAAREAGWQFKLEAAPSA